MATSTSRIAPFAGWMAGADAAARDRAFEAMLQMKRLDIEALRRAYEGR